MKKSFFVSLGVLVSSLFAQPEISAILSMPVGNFAQSGNNGGDAQFGGGLGISGLYSVNQTFKVGADVFALFNALNQQDAANSLVQEGATSASISGGNYFNFPILANVEVGFPVNENVTLSLAGGIGIDFLSVTDADVIVNGNAGKITFSCTPGLAFSGGLKLNFQNLFLAVKYIGLGDHTISADLSSSNGNSTSSSNQSVALVSFLGGYDF